MTVVLVVITRVVIESRKSRVPNYFLEPRKRFSLIPRIGERESQTIGLLSATATVKSPPVATRLLSIDRLCSPYTRVHDVGERAPVGRPRAEMNDHCLQRLATTHDAVAAIVPVVADESLELEPDDSSQRTFTARPLPRPRIDSLAVISTRTCHHYVWTVYLF